ncbi:unnamed protein product [Anisakis simplex]|uniref:Uncharacterized protein n=1 Tax=Anisakis simplex TaxID=6269 RepID=A0A3P6SIA8_ANISI|nr:unnamed protein product [Anisakis simplex]
MSDLSKTIQELRHALKYQEIIDSLTSDKNDVERSLEEKTTLLTEAYERINELEDSLSKSSKEREEAIEKAVMERVKVMSKGTEYTRKLEEDETFVHEERYVVPRRSKSPPDDVSQIRLQLDQLHSEMEAKNAELAKVLKLKDEAEWCLGEHRQWLSEANDRNSQMSGELAEKQRAIDALNGEKDRLQSEVAALSDKLKETLSADVDGVSHTELSAEETCSLEAKLREKEDQLHKAVTEIDEKEEEINQGVNGIDYLNAAPYSNPFRPYTKFLISAIYIA